MAAKLGQHVRRSGNGERLHEQLEQVCGREGFELQTEPLMSMLIQTLAGPLQTVGAMLGDDVGEGVGQTSPSKLQNPSPSPTGHACPPSLY